NGTTWSPLGLSFWTSFALAFLPNGDPVVGGSFPIIPSATGSVTLNNIARWNGTAWAPLGAGMTGAAPDGSQAFVTSLEVLPGGGWALHHRRRPGLRLLRPLVHAPHLSRRLQLLRRRLRPGHLRLPRRLVHARSPRRLQRLRRRHRSGPFRLPRRVVQRMLKR